VVIIFLFLSFCSVKSVATIIKLTVVLQQVQVIGNMCGHCRGLARDCHNVVSSEGDEHGYEYDGGKLFVQIHIFMSWSKLSCVLIVLLRPPELGIVVHCCIVRGKFNKSVTNRDLKETNGDNDIQTAFIFQCNLQTNLNTCPTVSLAPGNLCRKILVVAV